MSRADAAPPDTSVTERPASGGQIRSAYVDTAVVGYTVYAVGAVAAFIAAALSLSDAEAGLHASVFAAGIVVAGAVTDRVDRRIGTRATHIAALVALAIGSVALAWAPSFAMTLSAAALAGVGAGVLAGHANRTASAGGGTVARTQVARVSMTSMFGSLVVPLVIVLGESTGIGWRAFILPAAVLIIASLSATARNRPIASVSDERGSLPAPYWIAWLLTSLIIGIEATTVVWSGSLIEIRAGIALSDAAIGLAAFIVGIIVGRTGLSLGVLSRRDPITLMRFSIGATLVGSVLVWASTVYVLSASGLFIAGLGIGALFPLAAAVALGLGSGKPRRAAARLVLGVGTAILIAPFMLGLAADLSTIEVAWAVIPLMCVAVLVLTVPLGRSERRT